MKHSAEEVTHKVQVGKRKSKASATKYKMKWELKKKRRKIARRSRAVNARRIKC